MRFSRQQLTSLLLAALAAGTVSAKDVFIAADGDDANDGLSPASAVKSLTRLDAVIEKNDIVHISGLIDMAAEKPEGFDTSVDTKWSDGGVWATTSQGKYQGFNISSRDNTRWQGITFVGEDPDFDGFDGKGLVPHFIIRGKNNNGTTFRNLAFVNGISNINGGTLVFRDEAVAVFENCHFINNHPDWDTYELSDNLWKAKSGASEKGGCVRTEGNCVLSFNSCLFENNINRQGGAIFLSGTAKDRTRSGEVKIYNSVFRDNSAYGCVDGIEENVLDNSKGGAIAVYALNNEVYLDIDHCIFDSNRTKNEAGAIWIYDNTTYGHYSDVTITNSAFYGNEANSGGAIEICHTNSLFQDKDWACCQKIKIANSTFSRNKAATNGGAVLFWGASTNPNFSDYPTTELWMINCTMIGNYTNGNGGHGAGYKEMDNGDNGKIDHADRHFWNCLFEGNLALHDGTKLENSDFTTSFVGQDIRNSFIGRIYVGGGMSVDDFVAALQHNDNLEHSYSGNDVEGDNMYYLANDDYAPNIYDYTCDNRIPVPFIPLSADSPLKTAGNPALLVLADATVANPAKADVAHPMKGVDISKEDQLGFKRDGQTCAVGAAEAWLEDILNEYLEDENELPYTAGNPDTSISRNAINPSVITRTGNEYVAPGATIYVYSLSGVLVASASERISTADLAEGVYVVKAVSPEGTSLMKVIR